MCGIVGAVSPRNVVAVLIDGIRRLGELRDAGLLTEDEFQAKKQQLLDRI